jgi:hypothetical protein
MSCGLLWSWGNQYDTNRQAIEVTFNVTSIKAWLASASSQRG